MADHFDDLTAEYERLMLKLFGGEAIMPSTVTDTVLHLMRRLGPPSLTEASEIERREAPDRT